MMPMDYIHTLYDFQHHHHTQGERTYGRTLQAWNSLVVQLFLYFYSTSHGSHYQPENVYMSALIKHNR